jgi:hypothetical protein
MLAVLLPCELYPYSGVKLGKGFLDRLIGYQLARVFASIGYGIDNRGYLGVKARSRAFSCWLIKEARLRSTAFQIKAFCSSVLIVWGVPGVASNV